MEEKKSAIQTLQNENILDEVDSDIITQTAKKFFGITYLYPWQLLVIANILDTYSYKTNEKIETPENNGREIVLLPTGAGKSLCFMIPALLLPTPTLILYPLLALMTDQMRRMEECGISYSVFRGNQTDNERKENFIKIENGAKIILANPEVLQSNSLIEKLLQFEISHIAIDEAHCVSEWGDSFRPAYLTLGDLIKKTNPPVVTAFTATASPEVLERMSNILFEGNAHIVRGCSDRPNIQYTVINSYAKQKTALLLAKQLERPIIVFCSSRKKTETFAQELISFLEENDTVRFYHAGLEKVEKESIEKWFYPKNDAILVATCAFGMGVDKKNIRTVIHLDAPETAESYIQEAGRGGRDGETANSYLLWSASDSKKAAAYPKGSRKRVLADFAESTTCRRQVLLDALGAEKTACEGCDICNGTVEQKSSDGEKVYSFIKAHKKIYNSGSFSSLIRKEFNRQSFKIAGMNIWTEKDIHEIISQLENINRIKICKFPWKNRLDVANAKIFHLQA